MARLRWRAATRLLVIAAAAAFAATPAAGPPSPAAPVAPAAAAARTADGYVAPGDFDGDGRMDLAVKHDTGDWTIDLAANGFGTWDRSFPGFGGAEYVAAPADYDGDRRADLAVRVFAIITGPDREPAASTAYWNIDYAANGFGAWDRIVPMIVGDATPVPADYDGDGRADLADKDVSGVWRIDHAANGFGAWDVIRTGYGFSDATPVPADYDGDRRADLSVKSDAGGWYIDYAANGFGVWDLVVTGYGGTTARPVPADYDGDGRADLAVRRDDGAWFVDLAADGFGAWNGSRRHDDASLPAGALSNPTGRPIGGGEGYGDWVTVGVRVSTAAGLRDALATATPGSVIYVCDDAEIDLDDLGEFAAPAARGCHARERTRPQRVARRSHPQ